MTKLLFVLVIILTLVKPEFLSIVSIPTASPISKGNHLLNFNKKKLILNIVSQSNWNYGGGILDIGTPEQMLSIGFTINSDSAYLSLHYCNSWDCIPKGDAFDPSQSSTFKNGTANIGIDNFKIGSIVAHNMNFGFGKLLNSAYDILIGLGFRTNNDYAKPFLASLIEQGIITKNSFAVYLNNQDQGEICLGDNDSDKYTGELNYFDLVDDQSYTINIDSYTVKGQNYGKNFKGIFDFNTFGISLPNSIADGFFMNFQGTLDCKNIGKYPDLIIIIGQIDYLFKPEDYISVKKDDPNENCSLAILRSFDETFKFGSTFTKRFYTDFDTENKRIGFARVIQ